eukprot:CAMPEP_0113871070 /NCGR_PEP_ID=MMETSP0780_2-20120614/2435_1 /TAXON_ID=652834 /ORGANISM="Palpitomonas bilix" /LENGTH=97 /DNA_ID=CAMNT_0000856413 /DNA_START=674 /DNA_END=963 /DNA_ORIENTATION=+ /assembly_acc=CAM_ASM_000599
MQRLPLLLGPTSSSATIESPAHYLQCSSVEEAFGRMQPALHLRLSPLIASNIEQPHAVAQQCIHLQSSVAHRMSLAEHDILHRLRPRHTSKHYQDGA